MIKYQMQIIGKLGADATLKHINADLMVINFNTATNDNYKNKDGAWEERTYWTQCSYFIKKENKKFLDSLKKGTSVAVVGKPQVYKYTDKQGEVQTGIQLNIDELQFC